LLAADMLLSLLLLRLVSTLRQRPGLNGAFLRPRSVLGVGLMVGVLALAFFRESSRGLSASEVAISIPPVLAQATNVLSLREFLQLVIERNESLHSRILEYEITHKRLQAEQGIFEPELTLGYDRVENERENTAEQRRSSGVLVFKEKNNVYNAGIEALVPTGARIRLGYSLRDLRNNLQDPTVGSIVTNLSRGEYSTFAGVSLTQPLLRNAWFPATMANIRLAALASDVAFQEYRRQMMLIISTAEASYWNLYLTQEQVKFFEESVRLAETIVADNRVRFAAGAAAELEILEAQAGLALRQSKLVEARQRYHETAAQLFTLVAVSTPGTLRLIQASDQPGVSVAVPQFVESGQAALDLNPDYQAQFKKVKQEELRLAYARNQRLPQLDLKTSYGLNGLGMTPGDSWNDVERADYPSFSAGVELRVPLAGGIKSRRELEAARLRRQQSLSMLKEIETQVLNAVDTAISKVTHAVESASNYEKVVAFSQNLLTNELARLDAGRVSSRRVLEVEASVFEARNSVVEARVLYERARIELELVQGTLLRTRHVDLPQKELEERTTTLLRHLGVTEHHLNILGRELRDAYQRNSSTASPEETIQPGSSPGAAVPATPTPEEFERALRLLRDKLRENPDPSPGPEAPTPAAPIP
jgi:outer membrane protein TolC